jgi:hypothetical protein
VTRVEDDPGVVGVTAEVVAVGEGGAHLVGIGILELEGGVEIPLVVGDVADVLYRSGNVVAGVGLEPRLDGRDALPSRVVQLRVDGDRSLRADDLDLGRGRGRWRGIGSVGRDGEGQRNRRSVQSDGQRARTPREHSAI